MVNIFNLHPGHVDSLHEHFAGGFMRYLFRIFLIFVSLFSLSSKSEEMLNTTEKRIRDSASLVAELNKKELSSEFKGKVLQKLKSDKDREVFDEIVRNWSKKKFAVAAYLDEYFITYNDIVYSRLRIEKNGDNFLVHLDDQKPFVVKSDDIFNSLRQRKTADRGLNKYYSLFFSEVAWAKNKSDDIIDENQLMFTIVGGQLIQHIEKSVFNRDQNIEIKMGNSLLPTTQYEWYNWNNLRTSNDLQCSNQFSGEIEGIKYSAEVKDDKIEFQVAGKDKKFEMKTSSHFKDKSEYVLIESLCEGMSNCEEIELKNYRMISLKEKFKKTVDGISELNMNFVAENGLQFPPKSTCNMIRSAQNILSAIPANKDKRRDWSFAKPDPYFDCKMTDKLPKVAEWRKKIYLKKLESLKLDQLDAKREIENFRLNFFNNLHRAAHHIKSINRCCNSQKCREDLLSKKKIRLNPENNAAK